MLSVLVIIERVGVNSSANTCSGATPEITPTNPTTKRLLKRFIGERLIRNSGKKEGENVSHARMGGQLFQYSVPDMKPS
jgi:hypothetical protein